MPGFEELRRRARGCPRYSFGDFLCFRFFTQVWYLRVPFTVSPAVVSTTIRTLNVPFGRPRRFTVAACRSFRKNLALKTRTFLPFTNTSAVWILRPPGWRMWIRNLRLLTHFFVEGRPTTLPNDGLPATGVPTFSCARLGGASRLKNVALPGESVGEKFTVPLLASVVTFENQVAGPSYPFCVVP